MGDPKEILDNIDGYIHCLVQGLVEFGDEVIQRSVEVNRDRASLLSTAPSYDNFVQWLVGFSADQVNKACSSWHTETSTDGLHLFLTRSAIFKSSTEDAWLDVQAIGYFCLDASVNYQVGFLSLCAHAQNVFMSQPTRLCLHGLYMRKSLVEAWIFDRSGLYCCQAFNWQDNFIRFSSLMINYRFMTDKDLGMSDIIKNDDGGNYITFDDGPLQPLQKLYLEKQAIALSESIVGEGTTCLRAKMLGSQRWEYVVKFKWRLATERPEEELLKLAKEKNAWGVVSLDYTKLVDSTANMRQGLHFGPYRRFLARGHDMEASDADGIVEHSEETKKAFEDRIFTCVVTSPVGRALNTFNSHLELLQVLRDAVKAHRSLFQGAKILHQDVSTYNIIIVDAQREGDPNGVLIDLDGAMNLAVGPGTAGEVVGTRPFMSIGILKRRRHTYRHDLESFLYVFLYVVISNGCENPPKASRLRQWNQGTWDESAKLKTHDMDKHHFASTILSEFLPEFHSLKPLAEELRQILFPVQDGELWTGTDSSPAAINNIYDGIVGAFEAAIVLERHQLFDK